MYKNDYLCMVKLQALFLFNFLYFKNIQGTCIKDTWTKPKGVGLRVGQGAIVG